MQEIIIDSYAKVNLSLDVVNKRKDGYHNIETIMQEVDLKDQLYIRPRASGIVIKSNNKDLPLDETNLVYKAYTSLKSLKDIDRGVEVYIDKKIPLGGGLAGGSSNCAAMLKGLNKLWDLGYSLEELKTIGSKLGADVAFCLEGGTAYGEGIGDRLTRLKSFKGEYILLCNNGVHISTPEVYRELAIGEKPRKTRVKDKIDYIEKRDLVGLGANMENIMEDVVFEKYPEIKSIKYTMLEHGSLASLMSGSGGTVFGIFDDYEKALTCRDSLKKKIGFVYIGKTR